MKPIPGTMSDHIELSTPRLILRHWRQEDAPVLYSLASDPEIGNMAGWKPHDSIEESRSIIDTVFSDPGVFAIVSRVSNTPIGCIGLNRDPKILRKGPRDAEVGYWIGRRYWEQGFASEALEAVLAYGFSTGVTKVWGQCMEDNVRSLNLMRRYGFTVDHRGVFENPYLGEVVTVVLCLSRKQWTSKRS